MTGTLMIRGRYPGAARTVDVYLREGRVERILPSGTGAPDLGGAQCLIAPGLVDMQVNGANGLDLQSADLVSETVYALNAFMISRGVFHWMPTLVTDSADALEHKCRMLAAALEDPALARHIPGIHLEGPFISPEDGPRGAHPAAHVKKPDKKMFNRLQRAAGGHIRLVTLAPELPGALSLIQYLSGQGVLVSLGHHAAGAACVAAAAGAGARMCTHLGNGMAARIHRHDNPLWAQLAEDRLCCSVIADLEHLPPEVLKVIVRAKGPGRVVLVSDSVFLAGMKPGRFTLFGAPIEMKRSGRICLDGTDLLAGSSLLLPQAVVNMAAATALTLAQAFHTASRNPARLLGLRLSTWPLRPGGKAMFALYPDPETGAPFKPATVFV